MLAWK